MKGGDGFDRDGVPIEEQIARGNAQQVSRWDSISRERAEAKVTEWFAGVTTSAFEAAVELKIAVGVAEGDFRFRDETERLAVRDGARRFFSKFARKIIELSDGRCVYFAPDVRAKARGVDNAMAWAAGRIALHESPAAIPSVILLSLWARQSRDAALKS